MKSCAQQNHRPQPTASSVGYHELGLWLPLPTAEGGGRGFGDWRQPLGAPHPNPLQRERGYDPMPQEVT